MTKTVWVGLIIIALLVGLFIGYCIWTSTWTMPQALKYDLFKDILTIVLAVLAVGITVIGYGIYLILSERLKTESASTARIETQIGSIRLFIQSGFTFWRSYDNSRKRQKQYLEMAIELTEIALSYFSKLPDDEAGKRENDKLLCQIKNNLAYYYAERNRTADGDLAKEYVEYIHERLSKYSDLREAWQDTYEFVHQQYGS